MSMVWYEVAKAFGRKPTAREFERETANFLIRKDGRRDAKETSGYKWFPTEAEALAAIADRIEKEYKKKAMLRVRNAAPDLLEALEEILDGYLYGCDMKTKRENIKKANAAIARARGEV